MKKCFEKSYFNDNTIIYVSGSLVPYTLQTAGKVCITAEMQP